MNKLFYLLFIAIFMGCNQKKEEYKNLHQIEITKYQDNLNKEFSTPSSSPLTPEDLITFKKLEFFPIHENFKIEATLELTPNDPVFEMATTTHRKPLYKRFAIAYFSLNGKEYKLNVYQNQELLVDVENRNYLFLPFTDLTNKHESYKGGRYIDLEIPLNNKLIIDFNKAYNPYCAYNAKYSCPIVPLENHLDIKITAGVKAYDKH